MLPILATIGTYIRRPGMMLEKNWHGDDCDGIFIQIIYTYYEMSEFKN